MTNDYMYNKAPKDKRLYQAIRRTVNLDKNRNGFSWDDIANEIGISGGTLDNKLKPSILKNDITLTEYIHILEMSGDFTSLDYINNLFDRVSLPKQLEKVKTTDITHLVDMAQCESNDIFNVSKKALEDGEYSDDELRDILKEIEESEVATAKTKAAILSRLDGKKSTD